MIRRLALAICASAGFAGLAAPAMAAGDAAAGAKVFNRCKACHEAERETNKAGPHLVGIIGRTAGSVEGFKYSPAMTKAHDDGTVWTEEHFTAYMTKPRDFIPGNTMSFAGIRKPEEIANLIAYLESLAPKGEEEAEEAKTPEEAAN